MAQRSSSLALEIPVRATILIAALLVLSGCNDSSEIWKAEVRSPDGLWVAKAYMRQYGGPGTAALITEVYLTRTKNSADPIKVLSLEQNTPSKPQMRWLDSSHLEVTYGGQSQIDFQAINAAGLGSPLVIE